MFRFEKSSIAFMIFSSELLNFEELKRKKKGYMYIELD